MAQLFRSKSCSTIFNHSPPYSSTDDNGNVNVNDTPITTPFLSPEKESNGNTNQLLGILVAVLRKSLVTCSVERKMEMEMEMEMEIGSPKNVKHVSHVTFDRFNGFLGLPVEFQPEVPTKVPSASASVFGVSANSMQCSYDQRGNSVPTILLMMQKRLYSEGGLQAEGIFRINAENGQEQYVRNQMNKGFVPRGMDIHCLAGLIKAWLRELPTGVLDSLTPEQVMHCNTEEECTVLVKLLPPTEAALLDWAINLMADVVQHEHLNKMNARNIAMVFAPNMTQMADPLTALIHAVQVMNFLKTLIIKTLREREESTTTFWLLSSSTDSPNHNANRVSTIEQTFDRLESEETDEKFWSFQSKIDDENAEEYESISGRSSPVMCKRKSMETGFRGRYENGEVEGILNRLNLRKGVRKLCSHPVFQLSKPVKKSGGIGVVNT